MRATLEGATFNRLIGAVRNFTGKSEVSPQNRLIQLHFHREGTSVKAYALDGFRAAKECAVCYTVEEDFVALISPPPLKANGSALVEVEVSDGFAYVSYGDIRFRTKQPDVKPFDVQKFIDDTMQKPDIMRFGANVDYLLDALKSLKASGASSRKPVIVEFRSPLEPIILRTDRDNPKMVLPVRLSEEATP